MNNKNFNKAWKLFTAGATILAYGGVISKHNGAKTKQEIHAHINEMQQQISNLENQITSNSLADEGTKTQLMEKIRELTLDLNNMKTIHNNYISKFENGNISADPGASSTIYNTYKEQIDNAFNKANDKTNEISDILNNLKFIDDVQATFYRIIADYNEYLATLSIYEICLVINITTSLFIVSCIITILLSIFGNYLIDKFSLIQKYPKLSRFIQLRVKLKNYSIILNSVLILIFIIPLLFINTYILFNGKYY